MRGKVGAAHFEMIIGFVFFIGFIMFLFLFLNPLSNSSLPNSALVGLHISFLEEVETELSSVFVDTTGGATPSGSCFSVDLSGVSFKYVTAEDNSLARKLGGDGIDSSFSGGSLDFGSDAGYFRLAISPEFSGDSLSNCKPFSNYDFGSVVEMKIVSYTELGIMKNRYDNHYDDLKRDLDVVDIFDFAIVFEGLPEMNMEPSSEISGVIEILAKEYVVKVLKSNGDVSNERISIRIW